MHVCHIAEVETAEVYALKTMAVTKHRVDVRDIISLQVAHTSDGCEILTPVEPVGGACQLGKVSERIVEDHRCYLFIDIRPSRLGPLSSPLLKRSDIHTTACCLLVIVIECKHGVVVAKHGVRSWLAWTCEIARIRRASVNVGVGVICMICVIFGSCSTFEVGAI